MTTEKDRHRFRQYNRQARALIRAKKLQAGSCVDCGLIVTEHNFPAFDWDHVDPQTKEANVSAIRAPARILNELDKCVLRCRNCHAIKTWLEQAWRNRKDQSQPLDLPTLF